MEAGMKKKTTKLDRLVVTRLHRQRALRELDATLDHLDDLRKRLDAMFSREAAIARDLAWWSDYRARLLARVEAVG
jgi:hypothetical protein